MSWAHFSRVWKEQFSSLKVRIASFYALLFGVVLTTLVLVASHGIDRFGEAAAHREMTTDARVFEEVLELKASAMLKSVRVLARDFGFRQATATHDLPTIISALDNIVARASTRYAFVTDVDGRVIASAQTSKNPQSTLPDRLALNESNDYGIIQAGNALVIAVVAPIDAPDTIGWLVIGNPLDAIEMHRMSNLSPTGLAATIMRAEDLPPQLRSLPLETMSKNAEGGENIITWVGPLHTLQKGLSPRLVLSHNLDTMLGKYAYLKRTLVWISVCGMILGLLFSRRLANTITRPLERLEVAARKFGEGHVTHADIEANDEVGKLAETYNSMVDAINEREHRIIAAMHDPLTQLPNRRLFLDKLDQALTENVEGQSIALALIDLDDFKTINDTMGHPAGDFLLKEISTRLINHVEGGTISRLGGDEFAFFLPGLTNASDIADMVHSVLDSINEEMTIDGQIVVPAGSIGVAAGPRDGQNSVTLMKHADLALYAAKDEGKNCFRFFDKALSDTALWQSKLERDLRRGIRDNEFRLAYQPIYSLERNNITGFEALLRWPQADGRVAGPLDFIPVAEKTGLINSLGAWVIEEACAQAAQWPDEFSISVNLSPRQLLHPQLFDTIANALAKNGVSAPRLEVEFTENVLIENHAQMVSALRRLKTLGIRIALDDFGAGYSSLNLLRTFPFDRVKIDGGFVRDLEASGNTKEVIRAIIMLAKALHIGTIAEGVETQQQMDILRSEGCNEIQGFLLCRPISARQILKVIEKLNDPQRSVAQGMN